MGNVCQNVTNQDKDANFTKKSVFSFKSVMKIF